MIDDLVLCFFLGGMLALALTATYFVCRSSQKVEHKRKIKAMTAEAAAERIRIVEDYNQRSSLMKNAFNDAMKVFDD
jgi:hypothetical protein